MTNLVPFGAPLAGASVEHLVEWRQALSRVNLDSRPTETRASVVATPTARGWAAVGQAGLPWGRDGVLYLEHDPRNHPLILRGLGTDPGELWRLRTLPQVQAALDDTYGSIITAPWRLAQPIVPDWVNDEGRLLAEAQYLLCQHAWHSWTEQAPDYDMGRLMSDLLQFATITGFYLGELVGRTRHIDLGRLGSGDVLLLDPPELRASWTVERWALQREQMAGIFQMLPFGAQRTFIPADRLIHWTLHQAGPTDWEGLSSLRSIIPAIRALIAIYTLQALVVEVNGVGTWVATPIEPGMIIPSEETDKVVNFLKSFKGKHVPYLVSPYYKLELISAQDSVPDLTPQAGIFERLLGLGLNQSHKLIGLIKHGSFAAKVAANDEAAQSYVYPATQVAHFIRRLFRRQIEIVMPEAAALGHVYPPQVLYRAEIGDLDDATEPTQEMGKDEQEERSAGE